MPTPRLLSDRYEIVRRLRVGRLVQVYEGVDRSDGHPVAIEFLRDVPGNDEAVVLRFKRTSATAAKLVHPRIAKVIATADDQGEVFVVRELVEEQCLRDLISSRGQVEPGQAASIAVEISEALEFAHDKNVLHSCLTPSDVLLTEDGHVQLTGFGIAASVGTVDAIDVRYRAPEQAHRVGDERADLYALGCCLYEMLLGRPPFHGDPQLSERLGARAPAELAAIVGQLLEDKPQDRYQKASEVRSDLNNYRGKVAPPPTEEHESFPRSAAARARDSVILGVSGVLLLGGVVAAAARVDFGSEAVVDADDEPTHGLADDQGRPTGAGVTKSDDDELAADAWDDDDDREDPDEEEEDEEDDSTDEDEDEEESDREGSVAARTRPDAPSSTENGSPTTTGTTSPSQTTSPPGTQPAASPVPNVIGMSQGQANSTLAAEGLDMVVQYVRVWNTNQDGRVQSQSPGGGSPPPADGKVRVTVGQWCLLIC